ncbi:MAG: hypothetical protein EYC69_04450 [Bacteroidetes bacterium]|nr:MAG: hypothetical protein EYC69_04450 [Bacteroidota bacterium]
MCIQISGFSSDIFRSRIKLAFIFLFLIMLGSCTNDKAERVSLSDAALLDLIKSSAGYQYYKNTEDTLISDPSSPHGSFVRIRFNQTAAAAMNSDMSALGGSRFPDGSIVVKEIYATSGGDIKFYAAMFKTSMDENTGGDWIWGEYRGNGETFYSTSKKGADCTACHGASGNVDLVRTFSLH